MQTLPPQPEVVLPPHLPAQCFVAAASDYHIPPIVLVAMAKVESNGRPVVGQNRDGSVDLGVMQHNSNSWVPYLQRQYGISPQQLLGNACQSIRAAAYVLRREINSRACQGWDLWCGVGRYHHPSNQRLADTYVSKVRQAMDAIVSGGRF